VQHNTDNCPPMNLFNSVMFAAFGAVMEFLPRFFPSLFPRGGADQASCRVLWLSLMGAVQITIGVGLFLTTLVFPAISRAFSAAPARRPDAVGLPAPRGLTTR
jgi:hypothetical protein